MKKFNDLDIKMILFLISEFFFCNCSNSQRASDFEEGKKVRRVGYKCEKKIPPFLSNFFGNGGNWIIESHNFGNHWSRKWI